MWSLLLFACTSPPADDSGDPPADPVEIVYGPLVQVTAYGVRLRFETRTDAAVTVDDRLTDTLTVERTYRWPDVDGQLGLDLPDEPGSYTLHELTWPDAEPGTWIDWEVPGGAGGTVRAPPARGEPFRVGFVGDTMSPMKEEVLPALAAEAPDVFLHGGDIQYMSFPGDTWRAFFAAGSDLLSNSVSAFCLGNHEYEGQDEETVLYEHLFGGQGDAAGSTTEWHAFDYGGVRFVSLSSEADMDDAADPQLVWLDSTLAEVDASDALDFAVVYFHRPIYTLGDHGPKLAERAALEAIFDAHDVRIVLTGHNHSYERFETAQRTVVVDGGGGALTYDVNASAEDHPDDMPLRQAASATYGYTLLDFDGSGGFELVRKTAEGEEIDRVVHAARR